LYITRWQGAIAAMTVRLTWDGQYDAEGRRVGPTKLALPFQTIETVNESGAVRAPARTLRAGPADRVAQPPDLGRQEICAARALARFRRRGQPDLHRPALGDGGADFSFTTTIPEADASFEKAPSIIEQKAYRDTWGRGLDGYLQWFYETVGAHHPGVVERGGSGAGLLLRQLAYRRFILDLYRAQPITGYAWLHGVHNGRFVHVGGVDAPVPLGDIQAIVGEFWRAQRGGGEGTNGIDVLGWNFAFETNETAKQQAAQANIDFEFKRIPREVLEKKAVDQGDIVFYELAALSARVSQRDRGGLAGVETPHGAHVTVTLTDFIMPPDDVPEDAQRAVREWSQWIDYWAVDWDYRGDTFHNMAQTYRTRRDPAGLKRSLAHTYDAPGDYQIVVKVIDILGNDTTKLLHVVVR
jgi:hypothetical protein